LKPSFSNSESLEDFKHRLNVLTKKLSKVKKDSDQAAQRTLEVP